MTDQTLAFCLFLSPFACLWLAFFAVESARIVAEIRADRRRHP